MMKAQNIISSHQSCIMMWEIFKRKQNIPYIRVASWCKKEIELPITRVASECRAEGIEKREDMQIESNLALRHSRTSPTPELHHDEGSTNYLLTTELHHDVGNTQKETKHPLHQSCIMMWVRITTSFHQSCIWV